MHYSGCLHAKITYTCCWWAWLLPVRASGPDRVRKGGNVGAGYEKLIFAILGLSVIIASGAGMPRCPACRIICGGNEVWNSAGDSTGRILFLSMTYDCCAVYVYCDTIWLGLSREAYVGMFLMMWENNVFFDLLYMWGLLLLLLEVWIWSKMSLFVCILFLPTYNAMTRMSLGFVICGIRY